MPVVSSFRKKDRNKKPPGGGGSNQSQQQRGTSTQIPQAPAPGGGSNQFQQQYGFLQQQLGNRPERPGTKKKKRKRPGAKGTRRGA